MIGTPNSASAASSGHGPANEGGRRLGRQGQRGDVRVEVTAMQIDRDDRRPEALLREGVERMRSLGLGDFVGHGTVLHSGS